MQPVSAHRPGVFLNVFVSSFAILLLSVATPVAAQKIAVLKFTGRSAKTLSPPGETVIGGALAQKNVEVISHATYLGVAKARGVTSERLTAADNIAAVCVELGAHGVVSGTTKWKENAKKSELTLTVFDAKGLPVATREYSFAGRTRIPDEILTSIAQDLTTVFAERGFGAPPPPAEPMDDESPIDARSAPVASPLEGSDEEAMSPREAKDAARDPGAMTDVLLAIGMALNLRQGLEPTHTSNLFPGVRLDAHLLAGAFTDMTFVRDLGIQGMFHRGFALEYAAANGGETWTSAHTQWRAELLYRLAFLDETKLEPAFALRGGIGGLVSTIDAPEDVEQVRSVSYLLPDIGLDLYLTLFDPYLRLRIGGSYLFAVQLGQELTGEATGYTVDAGLELVFLGWLHFSLGWERTQLFIDDEGFASAPAMGRTDDTFNSFDFTLGGCFDRR